MLSASWTSVYFRVRGAWMVQEFTATAILAYECGYSEAHVRDEVQAIGSATLGSDLQQVTNFLLHHPFTSIS